MEGWPNVHQSIVDKSPIFNNPSLLRLWVLCVAKTVDDPQLVEVGKQVIPLDRGEFLTGRFTLHEAYNKGLSKEHQKSPYTVWRWLETLQQEGLLSIKSSNKYSLITVHGIEQPSMSSNKQENTRVNTDNQEQVEQQISNDHEQQITLGSSAASIQNVPIVNNSLKTPMSNTFDAQKKDDPKTVADAYYFVFGKHMTPMFGNTVLKLLDWGFDEPAIIELLLYVGEKATRPNQEYLKKVAKNWYQSGIRSRHEADQQREGEKNALDQSGGHGRSDQTKDGIHVTAGQTGRIHYPK